LHAVERIGHCERCNNFSEADICFICRSQRRDSGLLCVVESPADLVSLEQSGAFNGTYFVLMGRLSPLDGIGPEELGLPKLESLLESGAVREVILATNATVEGEATAHYIGELARRRNLLATRIACGVRSEGNSNISIAGPWPGPFRDDGKPEILNHQGIDFRGADKIVFA